MVDGTIASLFTGAWMPANLANSAADGAGKWRVTQMPTADGSTTNSENGGSSLAVLASTKKADAAYQFIEYANHGDGVATRVFGDYLGKSYTGDQKLTDGIAAWQKALQDYGKDQGFTVK